MIVPVITVPSAAAPQATDVDQRSYKVSPSDIASGPAPHVTLSREISMHPVEVIVVVPSAQVPETVPPVTVGGVAVGPLARELGRLGKVPVLTVVAV